MPDELIVRHCSPTLAGLKTGSLFLVEFWSKKELMDDIRDLNRRLSVKGLRILPMRYSERKALIYLYRPTYLKQDLANKEAHRLLCDMGYACASPEQCIVKLINKFKSTSEFPHEIGLFLSYPPEDVRGFIENKADNCKFAGMWKVYGDARKAQQTFYRYKKCTNAYCRQIANGKSIEQLAVAV